MAQRLISGEEARVVSRAPTEPCSDCPFSRNSLPGWLGTLSVDEWLRSVHGECVIDCHALIAEDGSAFQCAGAAIYRSNVAKKCWPRTGALELPKNKTKVFVTPMEFRAHHEPEEESLTTKKVSEKCGRRYWCWIVDEDFNEKKSGTRHCTKSRGHKGRCGKS